MTTMTDRWMILATTNPETSEEESTKAIRRQAWTRAQKASTLSYFTLFSHSCTHPTSSSTLSVGEFKSPCSIEFLPPSWRLSTTSILSRSSNNFRWNTIITISTIIWVETKGMRAKINAISPTRLAICGSRRDIRLPQLSVSTVEIPLLDFWSISTHSANSSISRIMTNRPSLQRHATTTFQESQLPTTWKREVNTTFFYLTQIATNLILTFHFQTTSSDSTASFPKKTNQLSIIPTCSGTAKVHPSRLIQSPVSVPRLHLLSCLWKNLGHCWNRRPIVLENVEATSWKTWKKCWTGLRRAKLMSESWTQWLIFKDLSLITIV